MSCVVAGLRYYFRIYKYEYLGELMTSERHIAPDLCAIRSVKQSEKFKLRDLVT